MTLIVTVSTLLKKEAFHNFMAYIRDQEVYNVPISTFWTGYINEIHFWEYLWRINNFFTQINLYFLSYNDPDGLKLIGLDEVWHSDSLSPWNPSGRDNFFFISEIVSQCTYL